MLASRHHPATLDYYHRLLAAGKPEHVALVASMRKHGSPWCDMTQPGVAHSC